MAEQKQSQNSRAGKQVPLRSWHVEESSGSARARRVLLAVLVLLTLAVVVLAIVWRSTDVDGLLRGFRYRGYEADEQGLTASFALPERVAQSVAFGRHVASVSELGLTIQDDTGEVLRSITQTLNEPVLVANEKLALAYDAGGTKLCLCSSSMETQTLTLPGNLLGVDIGQSGAFCYLYTSESAKTVLTVCSEHFSEIYSWNSKTRYLSAAALDDSGTQVAVLGAGSQDGSYWSSLQLLSTNAQTPVADVDLEGLRVLCVDWIDGAWCVIGTDRVLWFDARGNQTGCYLYDTRVAVAAIACNDRLILGLGHERADGIAALVSLDASGTARAELELNADLNALSAAGEYVAVLSGGELCCYDNTLAQYARTQLSQDYSGIGQRADGSVLVTNFRSAALYLP